MTVLGAALGIVLFGVVIFELVCFAIALYEALNAAGNEQVRLTPAGVGAATRAFIIEVATTAILLITLPLGMLPWRRIPPLAATDRPPLVFVPGWSMNRACFWLLRQRLRRAGWPHALGVNYRTVYGHHDAAARRLRDTIEALCARTGVARVILIAHSMGGVVCRHYLRHFDGLRRVQNVVTLASPHQGSKICALSLDPMVHELRVGSSFLHRLASDDPIPASVDFTAVYASFDHLVVPASCGHYPGAGNIEIEGIGHTQMLWSRRVCELVRESLESLECASAREPSRAAR